MASMFSEKLKVNLDDTKFLILILGLVPALVPSQPLTI